MLRLVKAKCEYSQNLSTFSLGSRLCSCEVGVSFDRHSHLPAKGFGSCFAFHEPFGLDSCKNWESLWCSNQILIIKRKWHIYFLPTANFIEVIILFMRRSQPLSIILGEPRKECGIPGLEYICNILWNLHSYNIYGWEEWPKKTPKLKSNNVIYWHTTIWRYIYG